MLSLAGLFNPQPVTVMRSPVGLPVGHVRIEGKGIADRKGVVVRNGLG
jgi:hypothetical protein